ncbi:hypothetical protein VSWAT3_05126 [Vibrionales bacterium SWAT-3]|nr:hypothetical protein VSWAT3_05126 [Vibrionales bacterium SWAT-3]
MVKVRSRPYHVIEHIVSDIQLLSQNKNIKKYSVLVKDPNMMKLLKGLGFEVFKFSEPSAKKCNITFKDKHYGYCILTIDKIDYLTNRNVMALIKDEYSTMMKFPKLLREARKKLKLTQKDFAAYINHLDDEWLCCVIQFRDRAAPFRAFLSQYGKFQAYLTQ